MKETRPEAFETPEEVLEDEISNLERPIFHWWGWAGAAVVLVVVGVTVAGLVVWDHRREKARRITHSSVNLELHAPRGEVEDAPVLFRWQPVQGVASYIVVVEGGGGRGTAIVRAVHEPFFVPTHMDRAYLMAGPFSWSVEARRADGSRLGYGIAEFAVLETAHREETH